MADLADINVSIEVDDTSVLKSIDRVARLEKGYGKLDRAFNKGKITAQQYSKGIQQVDAAIKRATSSAKAFEQTQMAATKASNRMGVVTQQAGYQVSDFIVQVQSGTNVFVAFGQQASQLVGVLPLVATQLGLTATAAIGLSAGLGIVIPLATALGAALSRSRQRAEQTEKPVDKLADAMKTLKDETENAKAQLDLLNSGLKSTAELTVRNEILRLESERAELEATILDLEDKGGKLAHSRLRNIHRPRLTALNNELVIQQDLLAGYQEGQRLLTAETDQLNQQMIARQNLALTVAQVNSNNARDAQTYHNQFLGQNAAAMAALKQKTDQEKADTLEIILLRQKMVGIGVASGRGGDPRQQGTRYQQEFGYKTIDELIAEFEAKNKTNKATEKAIDLTRELTEAQKQQVAVADSVSDAFGDFFMGLVDGTTSAKDAFRSMAADIIQQLYRILVVEQMVQSIAGAITGAFAPASAAGTEGTVAPPRRPTGVFGRYEGGGYTGSGPRSGGLDGKGGFMAMLHPRETVVDHTKGQSAGGTVVNQVFNISANTSDDTKRLITQTIAQASPAIINQSVGAVMNQRRRGGAMKSAFG